ncbi:MAG: hypothetical protein KC609_07615, partial [Myxococcales bacterium]|nr:hypothetical protein [Myxococcales bacterium]
MSSSRCVVVAALFFFLFIATGCGSSHRSTPPDTSAGDTTAGDTTAGDTTPGDSTTGDSTTGDTAPGDTAPGDAVGGETTVPDTTVADMQGADTGASGGTLPAPVKVIADPGLGPNASFQEIVGQLSDNGAVILNAEIGGTDVTLGTGG